MKRMDFRRSVVFFDDDGNFKISLKKIFLKDWEGLRWDAVTAEFGPGQRPEIEPTHIFATYTYEDYSGEALVMWKEDDKYFILEGSHCSCFGLEETSWVPSEHTLADFEKFLQAGYGVFHRNREDIAEWLLT